MAFDGRDINEMINGVSDPAKGWFRRGVSVFYSDVKVPSNKDKFYSSQREELSRQGYRNVIPDAVIEEFVERYSPEAAYIPVDGSSGDLEFGVGFVEMKSIGGEISLDTSDHQIRGELDALSKMPGDGPKEFWLVTTSDTTIAPDVIDYATDKGIILVHSGSEYDHDTKEMRVLEGQVLNPGVAPAGGQTRMVRGEFVPVPLVE